MIMAARPRFCWRKLLQSQSRKSPPRPCGASSGQPKLTAHQQKEAIKRRDQGEETLADIGRSYNVSPATISRLSDPYNACS
jgi:hypothetical protein